MLLAVWASTSPTTAIANRPQSTGAPPAVRAASTASSPPISPDQIVIGKTAARVITSHLPTVSSGRVDRRVGRLQDLLPGEQALAQRDRGDGRGLGVRRGGAASGSSAGASETCDRNVSGYTLVRRWADGRAADPHRAVRARLDVHALHDPAARPRPRRRLGGARRPGPRRRCPSSSTTSCSSGSSTSRSIRRRSPGSAGRSS